METTDVSASDVEKKLWEEKRREQDKLSSAMGEYLLKGYRMLDSYCEECGNILMGSPQASSRNNIFCLRCLQTDKRGDNMTTVQNSPAVSVAPANVASGSRCYGSLSTETSEALQSVAPVIVASGSRCCGSLSTETSEALQSAQKVLVHKLVWATKELETSSSVESCTQLTQFIQKACSALKQLKDI